MHTLQRHRRQHRNSERGFTLVELIIAAGLLVLLAKTATFFWGSGLDLSRSLIADTAAVSDGRAVLERLAREVREVKRSSATSAPCITTMTATRLVFNKTPQGSAAAAACGTGDITVTIERPASTLYLAYSASPAASSPISNYATAFTLAYFRADGTTAATAAADVCYVQMTLTQQASGSQGTSQATSSRTLVALRNN